MTTFRGEFVTGHFNTTAVIRARNRWGLARRSRVVVMLLIPLVAFVCGPLAPAASAAPGLCDAEVAALEAVSQRIDTHNAQPHDFLLPDQAAAFNAYNAEAAQLNSEKAAALAAANSCQSVADKVSPPGGPPVQLPNPASTGMRGLEDAIATIPSGWKSPSTVPRAPNGGVVVPRDSPIRPVYDVVRKMSPPKPSDIGNVPLQGATRPKVGDPDPAFPSGSGRTIGANKDGGPRVSPDHIVPLAELVQLPGFSQLTARNMMAVANSPSNLQWLSNAANTTKFSRSGVAIKPFDPAFTTTQHALEETARKGLSQLIQDLLSLQGK